MRWLMPVSVMVPTTIPAVAVAMGDTDHVARAEVEAVDEFPHRL